MTKYCEKCGEPIRTNDWYAYIRKKYCPRCAKEVQRKQKADWAKELRRKTREANRLTKELCKAQQREIEMLRQTLQAQQERIQELEIEGDKP